MVWTLTGTRPDGIPGVISWDGAKLHADPDTFTAASRYLLDHGDVLPVTPTGPFWRYEAGNEQHAWALAVLLLGSAGTTEGTPPEMDIPPIPAGAIP